MCVCVRNSMLQHTKIVFTSGGASLKDNVTIFPSNTSHHYDKTPSFESNIR